MVFCLLGGETKATHKSAPFSERKFAMKHHYTNNVETPSYTSPARLERRWRNTISSMCYYNTDNNHKNSINNNGNHNNTNDNTNNDNNAKVI